MSGLLADVYSYGDSLKRKLRGLLDDPSGTVAQFVNNLNDNARGFNQLTAAATEEGIQNAKAGRGLLENGPASQQLAQKLVESYNPMGMFIGHKAKLWDQVAAKKAQDLAEKGVDPRKIWKETGTFKGPDGAWRQEIDDTRAGMRLLGPKFGYENNMNKLGETMDHRLAYRAYPDAKGISVTYSDAASGGSYSNPRTWAEYIDLPRQAGKEGQRSTAIHELQHAIQQREGWAKGGSPDDAALLPYVRKFYADNIDKFDGESHQLVNMAKQRAYQNLAGEAEARATQARMNMDMAQRREVFPFDSYDVPVDQLILRGLLD